MGLVLTSRALTFVSVRLDFLCTSASPSLPGPLDYSARAHSLSARSTRCQFLLEYLLQIHEFSFTIFPTLLTVFLLSFILSVDPLSRSIKRDEPKGSLPLAYFISAFLIVSPSAP